MAMIDRIHARLDALSAQIAQAKQQYAELEQTLRELDRQLCMMTGGAHELELLLNEAEQLIVNGKEAHSGPLV